MAARRRSPRGRGRTTGSSRACRPSCSASRRTRREQSRPRPTARAPRSRAGSAACPQWARRPTAPAASPPRRWSSLHARHAAARAMLSRQLARVACGGEKLVH
jgi:hypothetical protein